MSQLSTLQIAQIAHELNRAYCAALGDYSQNEWAQAPDWAKASAIEGVTKIADGTIRRPEDSHASWMAQKEREGWKYGEVKNADHKTHPCMVPYEQLPPEQKVKDQLFFAVVTTLLGDGPAQQLDGFHESDGLVFKRTDGGKVRVRKWKDARLLGQPIVDHVIDAGPWASVVASVSKKGDTAETLSVAEALHAGRLPSADPSPKEPTKRSRR